MESVNCTRSNVKPIEVEQQGDTITIRVHAPTATAASDALVDWRGSGLDEKTFKGLVRDGHLKAAKLGRKLVARRSDVLALVDRFPIVPKAKPAKAPAPTTDDDVLESCGMRRAQ